jgi:hypothetical protein
MHQQLGSEGFFQVVRTEDRPNGLRDMAARLRAAVGVELATPGPLGSGATVLDSNLLIPIQRLRDGMPWNGPAPPGMKAPPLHNADRARIEFLARLEGVTFTGKDGAPTPAEIEELVTRLGNRTPTAVLAEAPDVKDASRGQGMVVNREDPEYRQAMRDMATGTNNQQVGRAVGGADRSAVADALFAERVPGAAQPIFYTDDERIVRPLLDRFAVAGSFVAVGPHPTATNPGTWPERFARANPTGFDIVVRGRTLRVVLVR